MLVLARLTFDGQSANAVQPGDSAVADSATAALRRTLRASTGLVVVDSARTATESARGDRPGLRCAESADCMRGVAQRLGATVVLVGHVSKISNLIWYLSGQLVDVASGAALAGESLELKGARDDIVPRGAASLGRRLTSVAKLP